MSKAIVNFSTEELKQFIENKNSCVSVINSAYSLALYPYHLSDYNSSIKELLNLSIGKYEKKLDGILLGYKNIKLLSSDGTIVSDSCHIHLDIQADFYVFKPEVGCCLIGTVNKKSDDHVGCLVHRLFNISIPKPDDDEEWVGYFTEIGQEIVLNVTYIDLESRLPYIRAKIDLDHFQIPEHTKDKSTKKKIKKETQEDSIDNILISPSKEKNHKNEINELLNDSNEIYENKKSKKKKEHKRNKKDERMSIDNDDNEISLDDYTKKNIKEEKNIKKRKHSKLDTIEFENDIVSLKKKIKDEKVTIKNELNNSRLKSNTSNTMADQEDRKNKKKINSSINGTISFDSINLHLHDSDLENILSESIKIEKSITEENSSHKKNKRNKSTDVSLTEESSSSKKKKRKLSESFDEITDTPKSKKHKCEMEDEEEIPVKKHKSKKKSKEKEDR